MLFLNGWTFYKDGDEANKKIVTLPHDAMLSEHRDINNPGGANISYFAGGKYIYEKDFKLDILPTDKVYFEFEGVYMRTLIYINDMEAYSRAYGYSDFYFDATPYVRNGKNHIKVVVDNSLQPNSRWYTGSGIYRPVHMFILKEDHILPRSFKVKTLSHENGTIEVFAAFNGKTEGLLEILDMENQIVHSKKFENIDSLDETINVPSFHLWDTDNPYLYKAHIVLSQDEAFENFGIRTVRLDKEKGLLINGKREILYGACIHHDNGLLGAVDDDFSNERKVRILKEAGYNAIRSAHNPMSRSLLSACDRIGMLVMDEYADCWYIHKTKYDYACFALQDYKLDLKDLVDKDYNHPSVIMYSEGNEVAETSQRKGIDFVDTMTKYLHSMDDTRPVTCGVNIFFNALFSWGMGVYSDKKADSEAKKKPTKKKKTVGSEFFNKLAGLLGADFMKTGATLPQSDRKTRDAFAKLDVAGYNYGIKRYRHDIKKYPDRFILGSETFCADSGKFYELAHKYPRIIGDFVWAGWDYIGEAGIGSWVAAENQEIYDDKAGWLLAGSGRIDILGNECAEMKYTRTAFRKEVISMASVSPRDHAVGHSPSSWKLSWAHYTYDYPGCEGQKTIVEVYSQAHHIELYLNDRLIGKRRKGNNPDGLYTFKIRYQPGQLKAVAYDENNQEIGNCILASSSEETTFRLMPENARLNYHHDLAYVRLWLTDKDGIVKRLANDEVEIIEIKNGKLLGLGNACPYYKGSYLDRKTNAYYGKALAIIKPDEVVGDLEVTAKTKYGIVSCKIQIVDGPVAKDFHI
jgi:beta-galactosidase